MCQKTIGKRKISYYNSLVVATQILPVAVNTNATTKHTISINNTK